MYDTSYEMLEKAVTLAGEDSRRGGEFKLWAVQALQSVGRDEQAAELLRSMKNHSDRDVRMVRLQTAAFHLRARHTSMSHPLSPSWNADAILALVPMPTISPIDARSTAVRSSHVLHFGYY